MLFHTFQELKREGKLGDLQRLIPYARLVGFDLEEDGRGPFTVLRRKPSNTGNTTIPAVHGGVVGALLEHAAIMQLLWECELERFPKIINISIDYLRPCLATLETFARGTLIKQGRGVSNVRVEAWQTDPSRPVAAAHAHFRMG